MHFNFVLLMSVYEPVAGELSGLNGQSICGPN